MMGARAWATRAMQKKKYLVLYFAAVGQLAKEVIVARQRLHHAPDRIFPLAITDF
jgi:hypothetical protein